MPPVVALTFGRIAWTVGCWVVAGLIINGGMSLIQHHSDAFTPTQTAPQAVELKTDPNSAPFDGLDLNPQPAAPAAAAPIPSNAAKPTHSDPSTSAVEKTTATPQTRTLEELVTAFLRNFDALKDAHQRKDKFHQVDYLKERERLATEISNLIPTENHAPETPVSRETEYLNTRAHENGEAIEDLRFCLKAIEQQKTAAAGTTSI